MKLKINVQLIWNFAMLKPNTGKNKSRWNDIYLKKNNQLTFTTIWVSKKMRKKSSENMNIALFKNMDEKLFNLLKLSQPFHLVCNKTQVRW